MNPYYNHKCKKDFIINFPEFIETQQDKYNCYFTTFTFPDLKKDYPYRLYREFFQCFRKRLENNLLQRSTEYFKRPILALFPEAFPQIHFHGILLTHKLTSNRFTKRCVKDVVIEYNDKLERNVSSIRFHDNLMFPYPKHIKAHAFQTKIINEIDYNDRSNHQKSLTFRTQPLLKIQDYKIYPISSKEERKKISRYSTKKFAYSEFTTDDIIFETKDASDRLQQKLMYEKKSKLAKSQLSNIDLYK